MYFEKVPSELCFVGVVVVVLLLLVLLLLLLHGDRARGAWAHAQAFGRAILDLLTVTFPFVHSHCFENPLSMACGKNKLTHVFL